MCPLSVGGGVAVGVGEVVVGSGVGVAGCGVGDGVAGSGVGGGVGAGPPKGTKAPSLISFSPSRPLESPITYLPGPLMATVLA